MKFRLQILGLLIFNSIFVAASADLKTNQLMIGDQVVNGTVSNGIISGDRWMVISNTLIRFHAEVTPIEGPPGGSSEDDSEQKLRLMFKLGDGPTKDRSTMHGRVKGLHGLLYMARGLNTLGLTQTSRVDIFSTEDKTIIVLMVRDNGPIYSSTNSGITWTIINTPGIHKFPLTFDPDGASYYAKATLYPSPELQTSTNSPPSTWYVVGSASDGSKLAMTGDSSPVLSIKYSDSVATLSWPTNFTGFIAQQSGDLGSANWTDVTNSARIVGNENQVIISPATANSFYRLKSPSP